jgi:Asp-tRNA(Asn)/Glu-tRNA(Gln) amidotransferase A subunit family amidase
MNDELSLLDATAQAALVRAGKVTAVELAEAAIERIEALNPVLNAVVTPIFDRALDAARAGPVGPFAGVPYLLKDLACEMEGVRFTEGSVFLAGNVSTFDQELVVRLRKAGLVILGKTQHAGVWHGAGLRASAVRADAQPMGHRALYQRVQRRIGGSGGVRDGAVRPWQRSWRLAAVPGFRVRVVRPQADPGS